MGIVVNTNVKSINAQRILGRNTQELGKSLEKLSSGFRINRAGDDAAGLQISEILRSQIRGSEQANSNVQDGINVLNLTDGAYQTITDNLQRVRELAVQGANDTLNVEQRSAINLEIQQLATDITRISNASRFNEKGLLNGSLTSFNIQAGAESNSANNVINLSDVNGINIFASASAGALGLGTNGSALVLQSTGSAFKHN